MPGLFNLRGEIEQGPFETTIERNLLTQRNNMSSSGGKFVSADCAPNATVQTGVQFIYFIIRAFKVGEIPGGWGVPPYKKLMGMCR